MKKIKFELLELVERLADEYTGKAPWCSLSLALIDNGLEPRFVGPFAGAGVVVETL